MNYIKNVNIRKGLIIAIVMFFVSCNNNDVKDSKCSFSNDSIERNRSLEGVSVGLKNALGKPGTFKIVDSLLFIKDKWDNSFVYIYNIKTQELISSFAQKGKGNGELLSLFSIEVDRNNNNIWLYDITLAKFHCFDIQKVCYSKEKNPYKTLSFLNKVNGVFNPMIINDTTIVGTNLFSKKRLWFLNEKGEYRFDKGTVPVDTEKIPENILAQAFITRSAYSKKNNAIVLANRYADIIELFDFSGKLLKTIIGPEFFEPEYIIGKDQSSATFAQTKETKLGYIDITCSDYKIYALFSGRSNGGCPGCSNFGNLVYVFNWDGVPDEIIKLDHDIYDIEYDSKENCLYGLQLSPYPELFRFNLK